MHTDYMLLRVLQGRQKYQLKASYLELYDEQITDLLAARSAAQLTVREDVCKDSARVYVDGLTEVELLNGERTQPCSVGLNHCRTSIAGRGCGVI